MTSNSSAANQNRWHPGLERESSFSTDLGLPFRSLRQIPSHLYPFKAGRCRSAACLIHHCTWPLNSSAWNMKSHEQLHTLTSKILRSLTESERKFKREPRAWTWPKASYRMPSVGIQCMWMGGVWGSDACALPVYTVYFEGETVNTTKIL